MKRLLIAIMTSLIIISCKETNQNNIQENEQLPSKSETIAYIENRLSNGNKVANSDRFEKNEIFDVTDDRVTYVTRFIEPKSNTDYLITNKFSINDIDYISEASNAAKKNIILNLRNNGNRRLWTSLNETSVPLREEEYIQRVYIEPEMKDFDGLKKAFENLIKIKNREMKSDYFDN